MISHLLVRTSIVLLLLLALGCAPVSQPWAGKPYRPPQQLAEPLEAATFATTPSIQPYQVAPSVDPEVEDAKIEAMLYGQSGQPSGQ